MDDEQDMGASLRDRACALRAEPASPSQAKPLVPSAVVPLEFRPDHKGAFDEIVARFADGMVHVETMSKKSCYVGFYWDDGRVCQWWISSDRRLTHQAEGSMGDRPRFNAQGIDTRRAETGTGSVHESPVGKADAPEPEHWMSSWPPEEIDWKSRAEKAEEALREAAETFDLFAADLRSVDAELHAQRIAVAELSAQEARQALSPPNQPQGDR